MLRVSFIDQLSYSEQLLCCRAPEKYIRLERRPHNVSIYVPTEPRDYVQMIVNK